MTREEAAKELQIYAENSWGGLNESFKLAIVALQEPERKHGQWTKYGYKWKCSECDEKINIDGTPEENSLYYCPNCGADMRGEQE